MAVAEPASEAPEAATSGEDPIAKAEAFRLEGNELLAKGDYADATKRYTDGLLAIVRCADDQCSGRAGEVRLALHLNASLAELRRGNLGSAVEHASGALAVDPKSTKALYRRGLARAQLAEHGRAAEGPLAVADFERALELEPANAEVRKQLQSLKAVARAEQKELVKSQKETFKGIFDTGKPLYEEQPATQEAQPHIQDEGCGDRRAVLSAVAVAFGYERNEPVLKDMSLQLREGWCLGLVGNNAEGKTTLARLMLGKQHVPKSGKIIHHNPDGSPIEAEPSTGSWAISVIGGFVAAVVAAIAAQIIGGQAVDAWMRTMQGWIWAVPAAGALAVMPVARVVAAWWAPKAVVGHKVLHVSSETSDKEEIPTSRTVEAVIGERLAKHLSVEERRHKVIAMLRAGGFQLYDQETSKPVGSPAEYVRDGLLFKNLSGGQKHLIYVLRCFASRPDVMLCDELLGGLDFIRQPRVLRMLRRLMRETGVAVLYISTELHQIRIVSDSLGFMGGGRMCELGPTEEVLDLPRHPVAKEYIGAFRSLPGCHTIGGKLAEAFAGLDDDADLNADWIPPA